MVELFVVVGFADDPRDWSIAVRSITEAKLPTPGTLNGVQDPEPHAQDYASPSSEMPHLFW